MSTWTKRLGGECKFDAEREADICNCVQTLSERRAIGEFISHLLRLAFESPEVFGDGKEVLSIISRMNKLGMTPTRYAYFDKITKEVNDMKHKVDEIYEMASKTYMLAQMGKRLGIEDKAENTLRASFLLERQITDMCYKIGVDNLNHTFASNKLENTKERADKALEYILESYDGIIKELKANLTAEVTGNVSGLGIVSVNDASTVSKNENTNKAVNGQRTQKQYTREEEEATFDNDSDDEIELAIDPNEKSGEHSNKKVVNTEPENRQVNVLDEDSENIFLSMLGDND